MINKIFAIVAAFFFIITGQTKVDNQHQTLNAERQTPFERPGEYSAGHQQAAQRDRDDPHPRSPRERDAGVADAQPAQPLKEPGLGGCGLHL